MTADLRVRVWVEDVWDTVVLHPAVSQTVAQLKQEALEIATGRSLNPDAYEVKFRGARVTDEQATLGELEVPDGGSLIVLAAQRRPVR